MTQTHELPSDATYPQNPQAIAARQPAASSSSRSASVGRSRRPPRRDRPGRESRWPRSNARKTDGSWQSQCTQAGRARLLHARQGRRAEKLVEVEEGNLGLAKRLVIMDEEGKELVAVVVLKEKIRMIELDDEEHSDSERCENQRQGGGRCNRTPEKAAACGARRFSRDSLRTRRHGGGSLAGQL